MDTVQILRFIAAFAFVMALMGLLSILVKRLGYGKFMPVKREDRRLKLVEYLPLDAKNRLVLFSRDDREHLVLIGADHAVLVEKNIEKKPQTAEDNAHEAV